MNISVAITLDGLIRALRWKEQELADEAIRKPSTGHGKPPEPATRPSGNREDNNDLRRR